MDRLKMMLMGLTFLSAASPTSDFPGSAGILGRLTMGQLSSLKRNSGLNEGGIMSRVTIVRTALLAVLLATFAVGSDKTPHTYQKGTIRGWENRTDIWGAGIVGTDAEGVSRKVTVFELKSTKLVYMIGYCGAFQAGQFGLGQTVDYRVNGGRLYIRRDDGKEYKCKIEGQKTLQDANTVAPPAKP